MGRVIRVRSVDTNPIFLPSRLWTSDPIGLQTTEGNRFAKYATVVTELYNGHLAQGPPLVAKTSWVRLVPTNLRGPRRFTGVPFTQSLGLGEVHEVPYDPAVLDLADEQRRLAILDWLQDNLLALADSLNWSTEPLAAAYQACRRDQCRFQRCGPAKSDRSRRYRARVEYEIDGNGDGWSWATITTHDGQPVVTSDRYDSFPAARPLRRASTSLRWHEDTVIWTPWATWAVPGRHPQLAEPRSLSLPIP